MKCLLPILTVWRNGFSIHLSHDFLERKFEVEKDFREKGVNNRNVFICTWVTGLKKLVKGELLNLGKR